MAKQKRRIPQINSSSSADIAFLLLIFFLITSSLDSRTGIYRRLNPAVAEETLRNRNEILDRNLLTFSLDADGSVLYKEEAIPLSEVHLLSKTFIGNPGNLEHLPEKIETEIEGVGIYPVTEDHVISLEIDRRARYESYIMLLNEITKTYNQLRDELSQDLFGKYYIELDEQQQQAIRAIYPLRIAEKEIIPEDTL